MLIQYFYANKILRMKQAIFIKDMALRDVRAEGNRLHEQETELSKQQTSLTHGIRHLRGDIKALALRLREREIDVPEPDFPLSELQEDLDG
ncbi:MAG: hypothetical protein QF689_14995 [Candidatus Latescibacteria bacterium]|nr:hypothetical protein [Candidatus Latescibacterota bacterium]HJN29589.1 hypothetical protein [Candidatus Latescibacterota bacterium]